MIKFSIITIFPQMFDNIFQYGIINQAIKKKIININIFDLRNYSTYKRKKVDDKIYGGGSGMLLMFLPLFRAVNHIKKKFKEPSLVIYLTPQGKLLNYNNVKNFIKKKHLIFICGRYKGIDERFLKTQVDEEWSIGDYILTGGEIPAMVFIDTITRMIPSALNNKNSLLEESFNNKLLDYPNYTRPKKINNKIVPKILLSGNHAKIKKWRLKHSIKNTILKKPHLLKNKFK
ncbi:tRNA (guanine-N(1)-)-methyltransferase [Buchnera aphidicola (Cinara kochiana kochiana)]|uniref:tRNA (guanine-N(1)-)-methyltransferase n=1 Tax=Buchnera aphidicola (Cinara kochiana kochiana) TaxID=2518976 RepID=A0A451D5S6_9GAMM|nr:tRNA (guanosine(37)-N1)-methyltransferase TrmD [Buchnera aphidicola]VFP81166.1 tRNA (guanine-N(1)-)-methyltransferase [Buchnera aphidicola (Cinara kochiana kochiana)]